MLSIEKFGGYKTEVKQRKLVEERERLALRNMVKEEKHLEINGGVEGRYWNENVSARPKMGYANNLCCKQHAANGMVDVKRNRCSYESCARCPRWGILADSSSVCFGHTKKLAYGGPAGMCTVTLSS